MNIRDFGETWLHVQRVDAQAPSGRLRCGGVGRINVPWKMRIPVIQKNATSNGQVGVRPWKDAKIHLEDL